VSGPYPATAPMKLTDLASGPRGLSSMTKNTSPSVTDYGVRFSLYCLGQIILPPRVPRVGASKFCAFHAREFDRLHRETLRAWGGVLDGLGKD
jgi:hypothetical protein